MRRKGWDEYDKTEKEKKKKNENMSAGMLKAHNNEFYLISLVNQMIPRVGNMARVW